MFLQILYHYASLNITDVTLLLQHRLLYCNSTITLILLCRYTSVTIPLHSYHITFRLLLPFTLSLHYYYIGVTLPFTVKNRMQIIIDYNQ